MSDNANSSNRDWQKWIEEQGLQDAPSASDQPSVAERGSAATLPLAGAHAAASSDAYVQSTAPLPTAQQASYRTEASQQQYTSTQPATVQQPASAAYASASPQGATSQQAYDQAYQQARAAAQQPTMQQPPATRSASSAKTSKPKSSGGGLKTFGLGFLGAALAFALGAGILGATGMIGKQSSVSESVSDGGTVVLGSDSNTEVAASDNHTEALAEAVADKVLPSVVGIDVYANYSSGYGSFWGGGSTESETLSGLGSGVVISKDGYILTNYHVVEGASKLMATVGGEELEATVVGTDESSDLAVIKVEASDDLVPVEIGSSEHLRPGQWVMTLGSPFGLEQSVATGIISATSRTVVIQNTGSLYSYGQQVQPSIYSNMIQTDAAINPGNSGGALVDENGKLIGINSVIESYSGSYSGVGFAIPVDYAMNIATQIIDGKTPTHAQIGVSCTSVTKDIAERYSLGASSGVYINKVYEDSGAQAAGLEQGDIITKVAGVAVTSSTDLIGQIRAHNVGETVTVEFVRGTETKTAEVTLGSDENAASYSEEQGSGNSWGGNGGSNGGGEDGGNGFDYDFGQNGDGQGGENFSYEELEELFNYYFNRR